MDWLTWGALVVVGSALALQVILIPEAVYQITERRPGFVPLERMLRKRIPATAEDCVLQGVAKLMTSMGILILLLPIFLTTILNASGWQGDIWGRKAIGVVSMACAALTFYLVLMAAGVWRKVHYANFGRKVEQS
jgi:hypothetical protein